MYCLTSKNAVALCDILSDLRSCWHCISLASGTHSANYLNFLGQEK